MPTSGSRVPPRTSAAVSAILAPAACAKIGSGMLTLLTKPGIVVDADDVAVSSGGVKVRAPWGSDVPVILRVEVTGRVRSGHLRARPPRRTFWQWLLRRPLPYQPAAP